MSKFQFVFEVEAPDYALAEEGKWGIEAWANEKIKQVFQDAHMMNLQSETRYISQQKIQSEESMTPEQRHFIEYLHAKNAESVKIRDTIKFVKKL